jgi:predicted RNA-binding Zn ribbon-like protein
MNADRQTKALLPPSRAGSLDLVGGDLAWDFTNTTSARGSPARQEHLRGFDMLMQWLEHARVMPPADCAYAHAALAANLGHAEIKMRFGSYIWVWDPRRDIAAAILGPITLSALTLLMEKDLLRTKRCAGQECGWLFFDTTKNNRRRWCEMRVCGNRAKVRAARQRQRLA